jgi:hypothetical protein
MASIPFGIEYVNVTVVLRLLQFDDILEILLKNR